VASCDVERQRKFLDWPKSLRSRAVAVVALTAPVLRQEAERKKEYGAPARTTRDKRNRRFADACSAAWTAGRYA